MKSSDDISFFRWWLLKYDHLNEITFFFKSKRNTNNKRFYPLYEEYENVRIVYLNGLNIKYFDPISLRIFKILIKISKRKIENYKTLHSFNPQEKFKVKNIILHIDDPEYSDFERIKLENWESYYTKIRSRSMLICTNSLSKKYFEKFFETTKVYIIEQGFHTNSCISTPRLSTNFICAYSSAYIHYDKDKHAQHSTWGSSVLIDEIIPGVHKVNKNIEFMIIGNVGKHARKSLNKYRNLTLIGQVGSEKNMELLSKCSIGLYTRKIDHNRSVLKIFTYIGAGLPIVTFDLNDTEIVKSQAIGYSVKTTEEFVEKILLLHSSSQQLTEFRERIIKMRPEYSWKNLATKLKQIVNANAI
jgi:glycosyltransferase involved in cell wall biosynthesis